MKISRIYLVHAVDDHDVLHSAHAHIHFIQRGLFWFRLDMSMVVSVGWSVGAEGRWNEETENVENHAL